MPSRARRSVVLVLTALAPAVPPIAVPAPAAAVPAPAAAAPPAFHLKAFHVKGGPDAHAAPGAARRFHVKGRLGEPPPPGPAGAFHVEGRDTLPARALRPATRPTLEPFAAVLPPAPVPPPDTADRPALFRTSDLLWLGLFLGSLAPVEPLEELDEALAPADPPTGVAAGLDDVGDVAGHFLTVYALSAATLLGGEVAGSDRAARLGLRALESLVAADAVVGAFKVGIGRQRPVGPDPEPDVFDAFTFDRENASFPSGHTAHLFALATAVSRELERDAPWVPWVAYPVAALTGMSRIVGREHWATDVVAGAAAGFFAGELVARLHGGSGGRAAGDPMSAGAAGGGGVLSAMTPLVAAGPDGLVLGLSLRLR